MFVFVDKTFEADIALSPVRIHVGARKALSQNEHRQISEGIFVSWNKTSNGVKISFMKRFPILYKIMHACKILKYAASYRVHGNAERSVQSRSRWAIKESVENVDRDLGDIRRNRCHLGIALATICVLFPSEK